ncbi:PspA/IM30 family protein, partial [Listeria monocytogenes]|nr:PspA/IM30 family protein [Listeria monocytogenes]EIP6644225.1 PspA/IM30 family protein [Listeria monocytogenes]
QNFKKPEKASMEDQLNELEKEAAKEKPKEEKEVLIPELEKKEEENETDK